MPTYVYGCKDKSHPRKEVVHKISEDPVIKCDVCKEKMHRVPQPMRFHLSPFEVLTDWSIENYNRFRARARGEKAPRFSPDHVNRPGAGVPQKDFDTRRYKR